MSDDAPPPPPAGAIPPPNGAVPAGGPRTADAGVRIVARFLDELLLLLANIFLISPLFASWRDTEGAGAPFGLAGTGVAFAVGLIGLTVSLGYYAGLEATTGRTLGKRLLGIRTVGPTGGLPTVGEALKRNAWIALGIVPRVGILLILAAAVVIIVTISRSRTDQGLHDELAGGTSVLRD